MVDVKTEAQESKNGRDNKRETTQEAELEQILDSHKTNCNFTADHMRAYGPAVLMSGDGLEIPLCPTRGALCRSGGRHVNFFVICCPHVVRR